MNTKLFEEIGLTKGEIAVYIAMLDLSSVTVKPIVDKSKVSYSKIYDILERLMNKGLVSYVIKDNKKYFEAAPVERIRDYLEDKEKKLGSQKDELNQILPMLKLKQEKVGVEAKSTIYKGIKGLRTAYSSSINELCEGDEVLIILGTESSQNINLYYSQMLNELKAKKINVRVLSSEDYGDEILWPLRKYTNYSIPATITIIKNKVMILAQSSNEIVLVVIDSNGIADSFKTQFEDNWNQKTRVYEGVDQIRNLWMEKLSYGNYCGFGEGTKIVEILGEEFFSKWQDMKKEKGIRGKVLIGEKFRDSVTVKKSIASFKFISGYETPGATDIFEDKIVVINFSKKPIAFVIEDREIAKSHQIYFDMLWKIAKN